MALELTQTLNLTQQLIMTPQLQQAIKLLQLSRLELLDTVSQEMEENPVLEEQIIAEPDGDGRPEDKKDEFEKDTPDVPEVTVEEHARDDIDWESYISEYNTHWAATPHEERDPSSFENIIGTKTSLYSHLHWQLDVSNFDERQKEIGDHIIGNLDDAGYLKGPLEEICQAAGYPFENVSETLGLIQGFDPVGVAARDMQECLLIQARFHNFEGTIVEKLLMDYMREIEDRKYKQIAKKLSVPVQEVISAISVIQSLEPKPGRSYMNDETIYISPDVYVVKVGDDYEIIQNDDGLPKLQINAYYKNLLSGKDSISEDAKTYVQEKLRSAAWLIKSIHQRQRTIYRVTESIVRFQRNFLDNGITHLKPLVLRDVAEDIEMHESTVSRVTTNKYVHTPQGIFELKFFFNSAISRFNGEALASESVKEHIRKIIKSENSVKPTSDKEISSMLEELNIKIARRTVAKYRESMGILSSAKRRNSI
ncbi:MAG: RNA polymerase factor sigma-54 [Desulfobacterales bacterium]|nr:RNA polymerase factor sigma-54 [Desulfobacterales bacterium]